MTETHSSYFTEIEDHFRAARGTSLFMLSPLDWALMEAWKGAGIPLEAVLRGIDLAFERWRKRPAHARAQMVNSLAYCTNAIAEEAQAIADAAPTKTNNPPPFALDDIRGFVGTHAVIIKEFNFSFRPFAVTAGGLKSTLWPPFLIPVTIKWRKRTLALSHKSARLSAFK